MDKMEITENIDHTERDTEQQGDPDHWTVPFMVLNKSEDTWTMSYVASKKVAAVGNTTDRRMQLAHNVLQKIVKGLGAGLVVDTYMRMLQKRDKSVPAMRIIVEMFFVGWLGYIFGKTVVPVYMFLIAHKKWLKGR